MPCILEVIVCGERNRDAGFVVYQMQSAGGLPVWVEKLLMPKENGTFSLMRRHGPLGEKAG